MFWGRRDHSGPGARQPCTLSLTMKNLIRFGAATVALTLLSFAARAAEAGYVDFGKFVPAEGCEFVEVNLQPTLLKFAAVFADKDDPEAGALLRSIKHVRVNVVGFNDGTKAGLAERMNQVRRDLEAQGWEKIVTVTNGAKNEDVAIFVKARGEANIDGVVVTVLDPNDKHAVFVNVVGDIKPEQLASLGKHLHVDPLCDLKVTAGHKHS